MASTKTQFIQAIKTAVGAIEGIGTIRGFNGQFDGDQFRDHPIVFPCVLWEITDIPWIQRPDNKGGAIQYATDAELLIHVGVRSFGVDPNVDDQVFEWADKVARAIASLDGDEFGRVERIGEAMDNQHETVIDHQIRFRFGISDTTTFQKGNGGTTATLRTLQQHGDIQETPADASVNHGVSPQYGTDNPND